MKAFIIYSDYKVESDRTQVMLFGKLENEQSFVSIHDFTPYFYIKTEQIKKIEKYLTKFKVEKTEFTNFNKEKVSKISSASQTELNKLYKAIHKLVDTYEYDLRPHTRFMIDQDLLSTMEIEGDYSSSEKIDRVYTNAKIKPVKEQLYPKLKIASIDIETDEKAENLLCISIYSDSYQKTFMITDKKLEKTISCKNEEECLSKFKEALLKLDPDIITGWNMIDFDLVILQKLFSKHKIPFDLGRTNESARLRIESNFFKASSADFQGRQVIDALNLIKDPLIKEAPSIKYAEFDNYTLEEVSQAILGKGKLIKGKDRHDEIAYLYKSNKIQDLQKLADYNLMDCQLVFQILEKTKIIDLAIERSQLTGMPLDRLSASIAAFDSLYIREAHKRNLVSPTAHYTENEKQILGGYVKTPEPGIYNNVLILDFKSLYPSILCTFNIDPSSHLEKKEKDAIESPNHEFFNNTEGILPQIIMKLHDAREKAKKDKRELASYAIKTIMNSFWGVLASQNCRYYNFNMAMAITSTAREIIQNTADKIENEFKVKVIYMDTDSCFVASNLNKTEADKLGKKIAEYVTSYYSDYVKEKYNRRSFLELQFQKQYLSMMIPRHRGEEGKAAKKRYAGLLEKDGKEELEITGLEAIRGDWTDAAKDFQKELLLKLFHNEKVEDFIKEYVKKIKSGKLDSKLIYRKSIRKDLTEYTKTTPPHVKAARKLPKLDSNIIEYYITSEGPEPVQLLKHKIDYEHYIDKQIKPIAEQILSLIDKDFDSLKEGSKQAKLF